MDLPIFLKSGEIARLFPVISETGKEQRASSIFLSILSAVPPFASALLSQLGQRVGNRTKIDTFTEVIFKTEFDAPQRGRPDGLIRLSSGQRVWTCLVESKIGKADLDPEQLERYLRLARENGVDALLTISNEFAAAPTHHPIAVQKNLVKRVELFHLSWSAILTEALLLREQAAVSDPEQAFLLREFIRFFSHGSAGVVDFTSMPKDWSSAIEKVQAGGRITKVDGQEIVKAWHQEVRNLSLIMSKILSCRVGIKLSRNHLADADKRILDDVANLCEKGTLTAELDVPHAASPILINADVNSRSLRISMSVDAPKDKARNISRINWLTRQLKGYSPTLEAAPLTSFAGFRSSS